MPARRVPRSSLDVAELVGGLGAARLVEPFGVYVLRSEDPAAELGRSLERAVFLEAFGNTPELLEVEYSPYESASLFLVVVDHRRRLPAGVMRVICPGGPAGLKSLNDLE